MQIFRASELFVAHQDGKPCLLKDRLAQSWMMALSSSTARMVGFVDCGQATSRLDMAELLAYVEHTIE